MVQRLLLLGVVGSGLALNATGLSHFLTSEMSSIFDTGTGSAGKDNTGEGSNDGGPFNVKAMVKHLFKAGNHLLVPMEVQTNHRMRHILRHLMAEVREGMDVQTRGMMCCQKDGVAQTMWEVGQTCRSPWSDCGYTVNKEWKEANKARLELEKFEENKGKAISKKETELEELEEQLKELEGPAQGPRNSHANRKLAKIEEELEEKEKELEGPEEPDHEKKRLVGWQIQALKGKQAEYQTKVDNEEKLEAENQMNAKKKKAAEIESLKTQITELKAEQADYQMRAKEEEAAENKKKLEALKAKEPEKLYDPEAAEAEEEVKNRYAAQEKTQRIIANAKKNLQDAAEVEKRYAEKKAFNKIEADIKAEERKIDRALKNVRNDKNQNQTVEILKQVKKINKEATKDIKKISTQANFDCDMQVSPELMKKAITIEYIDLLKSHDLYVPKKDNSKLGELLNKELSNMCSSGIDVMVQTRKIVEDLRCIICKPVTKPSRKTACVELFEETLKKCNREKK